MIKPFGLFYRGISIALFWWLLLAIYTKHLHPLESVTANLPPRLFAVFLGLFTALTILIVHLWAKRKEVMLAREPVDIEGLQINLGDHFYWNKSIKHDLAIIDDILERLPKSSQLYVPVLKSLISEMDPSKQQKVAYRALQLVEKAEKFNYEGLVSVEPPIKKNADWFVLGGDNLVALLSMLTELTWVELRQRKVLSELSVADRRTLLQVALLYSRPLQLPLIHRDDVLHVADDRICALIELLREDAGLISSKYQIAAYKSLLQEDGPFTQIFDFLHESERFNGGNQDRRIGFIYEDILYLNVVKYAEVINEQRMKLDQPRAQKQQLIQELIHVFGSKAALITRINQQDVELGSLFKVEFSGKIGKEDKLVVFPEMLLIAWQDVLPLLGHEGNSALKPKVLNLVRVVKDKQQRKAKQPKEKIITEESGSLELSFDQDDDQSNSSEGHAVATQPKMVESEISAEAVTQEPEIISPDEPTNDLAHSIEIPSVEDEEYPDIEEVDQNFSLDVDQTELIDQDSAPIHLPELDEVTPVHNLNSAEEEHAPEEMAEMSHDQLVDALIHQIQKYLILNLLNGAKKVDGMNEFVLQGYQHYALHLSKVEAGAFENVSQRYVQLLVDANEGERFKVQTNKLGKSLRLRGDKKETLQNPVGDSVSHAKDGSVQRPTFFMAATVKIDQWRPGQIKSFKFQLENQLVALMRREPNQQYVIKKNVAGGAVAEFKLSDAFAIGINVLKLNQFLAHNPEGCTLVDPARESRLRVTLTKEKEA